MGKKTRRHLRAVGAATSVSALRAARAVDAITPAFVRWYEAAADVPATAALEALEPVKSLAEHYFHQEPASEITAFEFGAFGEALAAQLNGVDEDEAGFICESIHLYIEFLATTNSWTGSEDDFSRIDDLFHDDDGALPDIAIPELDPAEHLKSLAGTELVRRAEALLHWLGKGKAVTSTGALRLNDIEPAAAAIGVSVRGSTMSNPAQEQLFANADNSAESVRTVKTMWDDPQLSLFWVAMQESALIDVEGGQAKPGPIAVEFLSPASPNRLDALRVLATEYLRLSVAGGNEWSPWTLQVSGAEAAVLLAGTTATPPEMDVIRGLVAAGAKSGVVMEEIAAREVIDRLESLAELGLVTIDTHLRVPPAMVGSVAALLRDAVQFEEDGFALDRSSAVDSAAPAPTASRARRSPKAAKETAILQIKVSLKDSKPPIWRRLLVRTSLTLAQLHTIIQRSFEWDGTHLHEFRSGGWPGTVYGPAGSPDGFGDPPIDERSVVIGEVLAAERDTLTYTYDFGDDWQHSIVVEKVLPNDDDVPAVRCTAGRGAAPAEDSGGVWGWQSIVEAVNDPTNEEHEDYREWLGLESGEVLDPRAFDKGKLNEELIRLY